MEWNDQLIARLRAEWADGASTAEIGRRIGVSKNAIVGKVHRLGLEARPSPIHRGEGGAPKGRLTPRRRIAPKLADLSQPSPVTREEVANKLLAQPIPVMPALLPMNTELPATPLRHDIVAKPVKPAAAKPPEPPRVRSTVDRCQFIIGEVNGQRTMWCHATASHGAWCTEHHRIVHTALPRALPGYAAWK